MRNFRRSRLMVGLLVISATFTLPSSVAAARPQRVGSFGDPARLVIEGAKTYTSEQYKVE